jgi:hypothetical protein
VLTCGLDVLRRNESQEGKEEGGGFAGTKVQAPRCVLCRSAKVQARSAPRRCTAPPPWLLVRCEIAPDGHQL